MTEFFLNIVNMSISASWVVLAVLLLRLLLKKAPKWITVLLWGIVAIRMICPFSIESVMSLIPSTETISPEIMMDRTPKINSGIPIINNIVNPVIGESFAPDPATSANPLQIWIPILSFVWIVGIAGMLLYTTISYFRVNRKIGTAVLLHDNIFQSESVVSPFVLGIIKPKIYLPFKVNDKDMEHVIAHEQAHIRRKDHWSKPFGFLLLALHWFNPLMWLGYALLCKDIELACDEKVIKELNTEEKADYSQALLNLSVNRRMIAACPLAFGEIGVKNRVKSVLNYKKTAFWIIIVAVIASAVFAVCFLTSPTTTNLNEKMSLFIEEQIIEHHHGKYKSGEFYCTDFKVLGTRKDKGSTTVYMWVLYSEYDDINGEIEDVSGAHIPTVITVKKADSNVQYELVEYWEPRECSYHAEDIRAKFPWYLHGKALDPEYSIKEQQANCDKKAQEYFSSVSDVGGADGPSEVITTANIAQLKAKYPQFFNVPTDGGLIVYIWQMAENSYKCYLANSNLEAVSDTTFDYDVGATIAEMRAILTTYDIDKKDIVIAPVYNPLSSCYYRIDDAYRARIQELFWKDMESE